MTQHLKYKDHIDRHFYSSKTYRGGRCIGIDYRPFSKPEKVYLVLKVNCEVIQGIFQPLTSTSNIIEPVPIDEAIEYNPTNPLASYVTETSND